jgi:hypothetical protein
VPGALSPEVLSQPLAERRVIDEKFVVLQFGFPLIVELQEGVFDCLPLCVGEPLVLLECLLGLDCDVQKCLNGLLGNGEVFAVSVLNALCIFEHVHNLTSPKLVPSGLFVLKGG